MFMDNVISVISSIIPFLLPFIVIFSIILKIIIDHKREERDIEYIRYKLECIHQYNQYKKLGSNNGIINYLNRCIDKEKPPNKDSNVVTSSTKHKPPKLTNCKNCGAPLHSNKCEFCDTEYDW
jgi:hypothetical protein